MKLVLKCLKEDQRLVISARVEGVIVSEYFIQLQENFDERSFYIATPLLAFWSSIDLSLVTDIYFDFELSLFQINYIERMFELAMLSYQDIYEIPSPSLFFPKNVPNKSWPINEREGGYLGYSGGRDSFLTDQMLQDLLISYEKFKVCFESERKEEIARIDFTIQNKEFYNKISISQINKKKNLISFHEADDVHITFIAPLLLKKKSYFKSVFVGLPFEAIESNEGKSYTPTETTESLQILTTFIQSLGHSEYSLVSIISGLHSLAVYNFLCKFKSKEVCYSLDSCWLSFSFKNNQQCGCCMKCQRIKYIFKQTQDIDFLPFAPNLNIDTKTLFSSNIRMDQKVVNQFKDSFLINDKVKRLTGPYFKQVIDFFNAQGWNIIELEELKYEDLSHEPNPEIISTIKDIVEFNSSSSLKSNVDPEENICISYFPFYTFLPIDFYQSIQGSSVLHEALDSKPELLELVFKNFNQYSDLFKFWLSKDNRTI